MTISDKDSAAIAELMRQVPKGMYSDKTLIHHMSMAKGPRPLDIFMKDIPEEIKRVGARWGVVYDKMTDRYSVWGGQPREGKPLPLPASAPSEYSIWETVVERAIAMMPKTTISYASFVEYFRRSIRHLGLRNVPVGRLASEIVSGKIKAKIEIIDGRIFIAGGQAVKVLPPRPREVFTAEADVDLGAEYHVT